LDTIGDSGTRMNFHRMKLAETRWLARGAFKFKEKALP